MNQLAGAVLMVRPACFGYNPQTAPTNAFQADLGNAATLQAEALAEFDACVARLRAWKIRVIVVEDDPPAACPDAVFPNNWFTTHHDGRVFIYPLLAPNRRRERRPEVIRTLAAGHGFRLTAIHDLSRYEEEGRFLEGTGSLVFDHAQRLAYAALSGRTNAQLAQEVCRQLDYTPCLFSARYAGKEIYHTNVMLAVSERFAVLCDACIPAGEERHAVTDRLTDSGRDLIIISPGQMRRFGANLLSVTNTDREVVTIMSETAYGCFTPGQIAAIGAHGKILAVPVPTIEKAGGGGMRCMLAEWFLPGGD